MGKRGHFFAARKRQQPAFQQILLLRREHDAGAKFHQFAQPVEIFRGHAATPENRRLSCGAISGSGSTAEQIPACATLPGMPQTTLVASSCAITCPPAATTSRAPA